MGKLFVKIVLVLFFIQISYAQESLCVYKVSGIVTLNRKTKSLSKGSLINKKDVVNLSAKSKLITIDNEGSLFELNKLGNYGFSTILKNKKATEKSGLTSKYFKFVWSELTHEKGVTNAVAGVFRGNKLMTFPPDNSILHIEKIIFEWISEPQTMYYFFIRNLATNDITKIETNGSHLGLKTDNFIFVNSKDYEWSVASDEFPNLENIPFYKFSIITQVEYEELVKKNHPDRKSVV